MRLGGAVLAAGAAVVRTVRARPLRRGDLVGEVLSPSTGRILSRIGHLPPSSVELDALRPSLRHRFVALDSVAAALRFVQQHPPLGLARRWLYEVMGHVASPMHLGLFATHLLDARAAELLLWRGGLARFGVLVDVGAGPGHVTRPLASLFATTVATESARPCYWRLRAQGLQAVCGEGLDEKVVQQVDRLLGGSGAEVDCIAALNVLDRCARPFELLAQMRAMAVRRGSDGRLLLALRLPIDQRIVCGGGAAEAPEQQLPLSGGLWQASAGSEPQQVTWEQALDGFVGELEGKVGLKVECFSRVPYICQGEHPVTLPFAALDDVVMVCSPA